MTWVKLSSSSLITYLKIEDYNSKSNDNENWVMLSLRIQGSGINISYSFNSLLSNEVDNILQKTSELIRSNSYKNKLITLEDEFEFIFNGDNDVKSIQIRYYLDYEDRNCIIINLFAENVLYFYNYLRLVTRSISTSDKIIKNYLETGIFQE